MQKLNDWEYPPASAGPGWYQDRGRAFERVIRDLLETEGLAPKLNVRPTGEQIDGSFLLSDRTFLLEAKWRKDPIPASDLYAFRGKVDGKLVGTIGVFISMSGYSEDAIDALKFGKEINLVLFAGADFRLVADGRVSFKKAMQEKLRYAAEEGQPYLPLTPDESASIAAPTGTAAGLQAATAWDLVVEGTADETGLRILLDRLDPGFRDRVRVWAAGGQLAVPSLVRKLKQSGHGRVAAIVEADIAPAVLEDVGSAVGSDDPWIVVVQPNLEEWMESACDVQYVNLVPPTAIKTKAARRFAQNADLQALLSTNQAFADLIAAMKGGA